MSVTFLRTKFVSLCELVNQKMNYLLQNTVVLQAHYYNYRCSHDNRQKIKGKQTNKRVTKPKQFRNPTGQTPLGFKAWE